MTEIIKIGILGIVGALFAIQFKAVKPEYFLYVGVGLAILTFAYAAGILRTVMERFSLLKELMPGGGTYIGILFKVVGITYICECSAGICKDAGLSSVASQIEILGKVSVLMAGLPILLSVITKIQEFGS